MRLKKGFTLSEILIVLIIIGAIAMMTVPSLLKGVNETQWKSGYKKAYNSIVSMTAMEKISGSLPSTADATGVRIMFSSLNRNLSVKDYVSSTNGAAGQLVAADQYIAGVQFLDPTTNTTFVTEGFTQQAANNGAGTGVEGQEVEGDNGANVQAAGGPIIMGDNDTTSPWIVTEDNMAYQVAAATSGACHTKAAINAATSAADAAAQSCVVITVDVNGLSNSPNIVEPQIASLTSTASLTTLTGDRYFIYVGRDGATAGNKSATVTGRIAGDLK